MRGTRPLDIKSSYVPDVYFCKGDAALGTVFDVSVETFSHALGGCLIAFGYELAGCAAVAGVDAWYVKAGDCASA